MKTKTRSQLVKEADKYFSLYVRYRDGEKRGDGWKTQCITCGIWKPVKHMQAGHFQSRRKYSTRWDEMNVNAQCDACNRWNHGEQYKYSIALDMKYGDGTAEELAREAQQIRKITNMELEEIIHDAKEQIKFYEGR